MRESLVTGSPWLEEEIDHSSLQRGHYIPVGGRPPPTFKKEGINLLKGSCDLVTGASPPCDVHILLCLGTSALRRTPFRYRVEGPGVVCDGSCTRLDAGRGDPLALRALRHSRVVMAEQRCVVLVF